MPRTLASIPSRVALVLALAMLALARCRAPEPSTTTPSEPVRPARDVIDAHAPELMKISGVVGVYEGETRRHAPCIRIMVAKRTRALERALPRRLDGYPVEIEETGEIRPMEGGR